MAIFLILAQVCQIVTVTPSRADPGGGGEAERARVARYGHGLEEESLSSVMARLKEGYALLRQSPTIDRAKIWVDEAGVVVRRFALADRSCAEQEALRSQEFRNLPCVQATPEELASYRLFYDQFFVPMINALATAENVARLSGDGSLREAVFGSVLDVVPKTKVPVSTVTASFDLQATQASAARAAEAAPGGSRGAGAVTALAKEALLRSEERLLTQYWVHQDPLVKPMPPDDDLAAVAEVIPGVASRPAAERERLKAIVHGLRERELKGLDTAPVERAKRLKKMEVVRASLAANAETLARKELVDRLIQEVSKYLTDLSANVPMMAYRTYELGHRFFPDLQQKSLGFDSQFESGIYNAGEVLRRMVRRYNSTPDRWMYGCEAEGLNGKLELPPAMDGEPDPEASMRAFFELIEPGQGDTRLADLKMYLANNRAEKPEAGTAAALDACGFDRVGFLKRFLDLVYAKGAYALGDSETREAFGGPIETHEASLAYHQGIEARGLMAEPLLYTEALRKFYRDGGRAKVTDSALLKALDEQAEAVRGEIAALADVRAEIASNPSRALAELLQLNPVDAWRMVAADWSLLPAITPAYSELHAMAARKEIRREALFWVGTGFAVLSVVTLGGAFIAEAGVFALAGAGGAWAATSTTLAAQGGYLLVASGALAVLSGVATTAGYAVEAYVVSQEYQRMRWRVILGLAGDSRTADRLLSEYHRQALYAVLSAGATALDVLALTRSIQGLSTLKKATRLLGQEVGLAQKLASTDRGASAIRELVLPSARAALVERAAVLKALDSASARFATTEAWKSDILARLAAGTHVADAEILALRIRQSNRFAEEFLKINAKGPAAASPLVDELITGLRILGREAGYAVERWLPAAWQRFGKKSVVAGPTALEGLLDDVDRAVLAGAHPDPSVFEPLLKMVRGGRGLSSRWAFWKTFAESIESVRASRMDLLKIIRGEAAAASGGLDAASALEPSLAARISEVGVADGVTGWVARNAARLGGETAAIQRAALTVWWLAEAAMFGGGTYYFFHDGIYGDHGMIVSARRYSEILGTSVDSRISNPYGIAALPDPSSRDEESAVRSELITKLETDIATLEWMRAVSIERRDFARARGDSDGASRADAMVAKLGRVLDQKRPELKALREGQGVYNALIQ